MSVLLQDVIVSFVALGAVTAIGIKARALFASKPSGTACGSCTKCPATSTTLPGNLSATVTDQQPRTIRLTVIQ